MPINFNPVSSGFVGAYRSVYVRDATFRPVLCESFTESSKMDSGKITTYDGKAISTIQSVGEVSQSMSINNSPVIVGSRPEFLDARDFFFYSVENLFPVLFRSALGYEAPLMESASLNVTDQSANMSFNLVSDGIRYFYPGSDHEVFLATSPDNQINFCANKTRPAYRGDFVVAFGPYVAFITNMSYDVSMGIRKFGAVRQTSQDRVGVASDNPFDDNRQYTHLVPGKMAIKARGSAVIDLESSSLFEFNTNYDVSGYRYLSVQSPGEANVLKQRLVALINGNQFELFFRDSAYYQPFFRRPGNMGIEVLSSYLTSLSLSVTKELVSVDFDCELQAQLSLF